MPALTTWSDDEAAEMLAAGSPHGAPPPPDGPADFLKEPAVAAFIERWVDRSNADWDVGRILPYDVPRGGGAVFIHEVENITHLAKGEEEARWLMGEIAEGEMEENDEIDLRIRGSAVCGIVKKDSAGNILFAHPSAEDESFFSSFVPHMAGEEIGCRDEELTRALVETISARCFYV